LTGIRPAATFLNALTSRTLRISCTLGVLTGFIALTATAPLVALLVAPGLLLGLCLVNGVMPGEALLTRLRERRLATPRRRPRIAATPRPRLALVVRRTGRFVTHALAMRPPPAAAPVSV
jgi:hypothetical protein